MATLRMNQDVELHYYDDDFTEPWRSAPTMLLQHGFSRSGKFWYSWVPLLAHEFRILRPDMRGMGRSAIPARINTNLPWMSSLMTCEASWTI